MFFERPFMIISFSSKHRVQFRSPFLPACICLTMAHLIENCFYALVTNLICQLPENRQPVVFFISENFNLFGFFWQFHCKERQHSQFFFQLFQLQIKILLASLQKKNTRFRPFPWKRSVLQNPDRQRANQGPGICLRLGPIQ